MRKLKLEIEALEVESFAPSKAASDAGTVRGYLSAYYEICDPGDTWQNTCTCEPTCNAQTCYNCPTNAQTCNCGTNGCTGAACSTTCYPMTSPRDLC